MERGKLHNDDKGKAQVINKADSTEALCSGGLSRSSVRSLLKRRTSEGLRLLSLFILTTMEMGGLR